MSESFAPALDGIRVLDFSQVAAGPYMTSLLGDLGADVVKIEPPAGDSLRGIDDAFGVGRSSYYFGVNRSKRSVALDLRNPKAHAVVDRLVETSDVVVIAMRPSAITRGGLDYQRLKGLNSRLIHVSITGFGESGPRSEEPGMDILAQALSGVMGSTGETDGPPVRVGPPIADISTSYLGAFAVCAALRSRDRDGVGQQISLNLLDSAVSVLPNYAAQYLRTREPIHPMGSAHPQIVPYQVFPTENGNIVVACLSDRFWPPLCEALHRAELAEDPRYRTNVDRVRHREQLVELLSEIFAAAPKEHWIPRLRARDVPSSEVHPLHEVFADPQVAHNQMAIELTHPELGTYMTVANPIRMSGTPPQERYYAPDVGEHSVEVLRELGYDKEEVDAFIETGIVRTSRRE